MFFSFTCVYVQTKTKPPENIASLTMQAWTCDYWVRTTKSSCRRDISPGYTPNDLVYNLMSKTFSSGVWRNRPYDENYGMLNCVILWEKKTQPVTKFQFSSLVDVYAGCSESLVCIFCGSSPQRNTPNRGKSELENMRLYLLRTIEW